MPTTSAIAGTVSGIRQMNSMARFSCGNLKRTQTMVGRSRTSMARQVITASSSEAVMALTRSGVWTMFFQASRFRGALIALPRVENSSIAPMGTRKKAPNTIKMVILKSWSLNRRDRVIASAYPLRRTPLQQRVQRGHDEDDHDHGQGQSLRKPRRRASGLAGQQVGDLQRDDDAALGDEGGRGCVRREGVGEQQQRPGWKRRSGQWAREGVPE